MSITTTALACGLLAAGASGAFWMAARSGAARYALQLGNLPWWLAAASGGAAAVAAVITRPGNPILLGVAVAALGVCFVTDLRHRLVFNAVLVAAAIAVVASALCFDGPLALVPIAIGAVTGFSAMAAASYATSGCGGGDVKLMALVGACCGLTGVAVVFAAASVVAIAWYIVPIVRREKRDVAWAPFVAVGAYGWLALVGGVR